MLPDMAEGNHSMAIIRTAALAGAALIPLRQLFLRHLTRKVPEHR